MSITRLSVGPRIAGAVVHGDTVYLAGQVAADASAFGAKPARNDNFRLSIAWFCMWQYWGKW